MRTVHLISCGWLLVAPLTAHAQHEADSAHVLHGLWRMSIQHPQLGLVNGFIQEIDASWLRGMEVYHPDGPREPYLYRFDSKGDSVFGAIPPFDSTSHGFGFRARRSPDGNRILGRWMDDREEREYPIMLERLRPEMRVHAVTGIENGGLDYPAMLDVWKYATARGNLPRIRIDLAGQDLPRNRHPNHWATVAGIHAAIDDSLIFLQTYEATRLGDSMRVYAWLRDGAQPGRKVLTIEGGTAEFELRFQNYQEKLDVAAVRLVRKAANGYEELGDSVLHGETFFVEARLQGPVEAEHVMARLSWAKRTQPVRLEAADRTRLVFRSAALQAQDPGSGQDTTQVPEQPTLP